MCLVIAEKEKITSAEFKCKISTVAKAVKDFKVECINNVFSECKKVSLFLAIINILGHTFSFFLSLTHIHT